MLGKASEVRTVWVQESSDKDLGQRINDMLVSMTGHFDPIIIDIKYCSANDENGYGWHSALIIYKEGEPE